MNTSEFFSKFKSRYLWGNIAAMVAVVFAVCLGVKFGLDIYTHHGEVVQIPNVRHLTSSSCHPKIFVKEFSYFLMSCH